MGLVEMKERLEAAHRTLVDLYSDLRTVINASMLPEDISVRDEAWRAAQHVLRTALIADNAARHIETKHRRMELENTFYLPDPYEADPFTPPDVAAPPPDVSNQSTVSIPALAVTGGS